MTNTPNQEEFKTLQAVKDNPLVPVSKLAKARLKSDATIGAQLRNLEKKGLIQRKETTSDSGKTLKVSTITELGEEVLEKREFRKTNTTTRRGGIDKAAMDWFILGQAK